MKNQQSSYFSELQYPLVVQVVDRHLVITSPDFNFPVPVVIPYDPPNHELAGKALRAAWLQIAEHLRHLKYLQSSVPPPRKPKDVLPRPRTEVSLKEACRISGLKPTMLRELADQGVIASKRTPKGHRRFSLKSLEDYARKNKF